MGYCVPVAGAADNDLWVPAASRHASVMDTESRMRARVARAAPPPDEVEIRDDTAADPRREHVAAYDTRVDFATDVAPGLRFACGVVARRANLAADPIGHAFLRCRGALPTRPRAPYQ